MCVVLETLLPRAVTRLFSVLISVQLVIAAQLPAQTAKRLFRAGAATSNITPPLGEPIVGGFTPRPAKHIHDELHARCLVLDDGQTRLGIVLCDNVGIPREVYDEARRQIAETAGLPADH